jgi:hypothetical protein
MQSSFVKKLNQLPPDQMRMVASYFNPVDILKLSQGSRSIRS